MASVSLFLFFISLLGVSLSWYETVCAAWMLGTIFVMVQICGVDWILLLSATFLTHTQIRNQLVTHHLDLLPADSLIMRVCMCVCVRLNRQLLHNSNLSSSNGSTEDLFRDSIDSCDIDINEKVCDDICLQLALNSTL